MKKGQKSSSKSKHSDELLPTTLPLHEHNPLQIYMREAAKYPLLSRDEEYQLAVRVFEHKDIEAAKILAQSNLRFVIKIAYEYTKYGAKILDLIQEGNMGLIRAIQEFNPYKETRVTTYAVFWIRSYIQDFLLKNWSIVRIGTTAAQKKLFYNLKKMQQRYEQEGLTPNIKAIAHDLNVDESDVKVMQERMSGHDVSLNTPSNQEDKDAVNVLSNKIADTSPLASQSLESLEQGSLFKQALEEFQHELEEREKIIFRERLLSENPRTLSEIGEEFGFTKERARQLEERIKTKLKNFLAQYYPDISVD